MRIFETIALVHWHVCVLACVTLITRKRLLLSHLPWLLIFQLTARLLWVYIDIVFSFSFRQRSILFPLVERGELDPTIPDHRDMLK